MLRVLHAEPTFSALFMAYLLARHSRIEADLIDQLFNSSEKRLARALVLLAHFGKEGKAEPVMPQSPHGAVRPFSSAVDTSWKLSQVMGHHICCRSHANGAMLIETRHDGNQYRP